MAPETSPFTGIFNIEAGEDFAGLLAAGILQHCPADDPLALSKWQILLPTRRSCRTVREAFLRLADGKPLLLPRLDALGDPEADELALTAADTRLGFPGEALRPAIPPMERAITLAWLILQTGTEQGLARTEEQAVELALSLASLLDEISTEERDIAALQSLAPADYADHWQRILVFLKIISANWPDWLAERQAIDPGERRRLLLHAQADLWLARPPAHPVIIAGVTGSVPATRAVMRAVLAAPQGAVVLPGLDTHLEDRGWQAIKPGHPQHGLKQLLHELEISRDDVAPWPAMPASDPAHQARRHLLSEAMRPAETAETWAELTLPDTATDGLSLVEAETPEEEAAIIACMLRETLEHPGKRAAVISPDRTLARRIAAQMQRFGVQVDDSAGMPLSETQTGSFLRLVLALAAPEADAFDILAALKHPHAALGLSDRAHASQTRHLDREVLRGPTLPGGVAATLAHARHMIDNPPEHRPEITPKQRENLGWLETLAQTIAPLTEILAQKAAPATAILDALVSVAEALAATDELPGGHRLWSKDDGEMAAQFLAEFRNALTAQGDMAPLEFEPILTRLMQGVMVRARYGTHPRLSILGPMEARLTRADRIIIAGMNEGIWPIEAGADPWLSRPMREEFGLPQPEQKIGFMAHDFCQLAAAPEVILTRSRRQGKAPAVPSRWLTRLETVLKSTGLKPLVSNGLPWADWRAVLDKPGDFAPAPRPAPCPPLELRPKGLPVTSVERWLQDPYYLYASQILRLRVLDDVAQTLGAAERGQLVHDIFDTFIAEHMDDPLPDNAADRLREITYQTFADAGEDRPVVQSFWLPRVLRIIDWFIEEETARRNAGWLPVLTEGKGTAEIDLGEHGFNIRARTDRIDKRDTPHGPHYSIIDYKTGSPMTRRNFEQGGAVQLTLTAMMLESGGFADKLGRPANWPLVGEYAYWYLKGLADPGALQIMEGDECAQALHDAHEGLTGLIAYYNQPDSPYPARPRDAHALTHNDYARLAREGEWLVDAGSEED